MIIEQNKLFTDMTYDKVTNNVLTKCGLVTPWRHGAGSSSADHDITQIDVDLTSVRSNDNPLIAISLDTAAKND